MGFCILKMGSKMKSGEMLFLLSLKIYVAYLVDHSSLG